MSDNPTPPTGPWADPSGGPATIAAPRRADTRPPRRDDWPGLGAGVPLQPHHLDAEMAVLGACMYGYEAIDSVRNILDVTSFYRPAHGVVWRAILALRDAGSPTQLLAVEHHLRRSGDLDRVGGPNELHTICSRAAVTGSAEYYARMVREIADLRAVQTLAVRAAQQTTLDGADADHIRGLLETELRAIGARTASLGAGRLSQFAMDGWTFVNKMDLQGESLWGTPEQSAWSPGESLMIVGPPGVGKTTLAHQLLMGRVGLQDRVLGMPVREGRRVLYLAMDRTPQIARALARRILPRDERLLRDRLVVWAGPLPTSLDKEPTLLAELAATHDADTVVIDSLKDAVGALTDDVAAIAYNNARQQLVRNNVQLLELHHQRKSGTDAGRAERPSLDRVYGSTWFVGGAGSVIFLAGAAGDPIVKLHHLKTPTGEIGPFSVVHDHERGTSNVDHDDDPLTLLQRSPEGLTPHQLAARMTGEAKPERNDIEKARRRLEGLLKTGKAIRAEDPTGTGASSKQVRYRAATRHIAVVS